MQRRREPSGPAADGGMMVDPVEAMAGLPRGERWLALRLSAFYAAMFLFVGLLMPYWPVWLAARGIAPGEIGLLLAAGLWTRVVALPAAGHLADRMGESRLLLALLAAAGLAAFALFAAVEGFWPYLAVTLLAQLFIGPIVPIGENVAVTAVRERGLAYGRLRLWGSLAFIVAASGGGWLLDRFPDTLILWLILGALALVLAACLALLFDRGAATRTAVAEDAGPEPLRHLLRERSFLLMMLAAACIQSAHAVYYGFGTLHWRAAGFSGDVIGGLWAEGVVAEIVLFALGARILARAGPERLLLIAAIAGILRWAVTGATDALSVLAVAQTLHAFTFGATHLAAMTFIGRAVPRRISATAQAVYAAVVMGAAMGLVMPASGALYDAWGGRAYLAMAGLCALGALFALALLRRQTCAGG